MKPSSNAAAARVIRRTGFGPLRLFVGDRFLVASASARRGRRYPAGAHAGAVGGYADCTALLGLAARRQTRFVRCAHYAQTSGDKSVHERAARGAASPALLVAPEIAPAGYRLPRCHRWGLSRRARTPSANATALASPANTTNASTKARPGRPEGASEALRSAGLVARARSALRGLTCRHLFERSERSERSEFGDGPRDRAPEGSRRYPADRRSEALRPAWVRLCRTNRSTYRDRSRTATGRELAVQSIHASPWSH